MFSSAPIRTNSVHFITLDSLSLTSFVYLETLITTDNNTSAEINNRITLAKRSYFRLVNILKAKNINRKYKVIIYKTLIKPVLMYGAETWVLSKADELRLGSF